MHTRLGLRTCQPARAALSTHPRQRHAYRTMNSEVLTRRTGEGGSGSGSSGAAEAAACTRNGGAEQGLLRARTGWGSRRHALAWARSETCRGRKGGSAGGSSGGSGGSSVRTQRWGGAATAARSLLRLRRSAPARRPSIGSRVWRQAWQRGEARRWRRAREWSARGEPDGRWPAGDEAREQPTPRKRTQRERH